MSTFGAMAGVKGRRAGFWIKFAALASLFVFSAPLGAQEPDEGQIGTFYIGSFSNAPKPDRAIADGTEHKPFSDDADTSGPNTWFLPYFFPSTSSEAIEALFKKAVVELDEGRSDEAQRLLEKVIAEAPGSALAAKARRYLATLYSRSGDGGSVEIEASASPRASRADLSISSERLRPAPSLRAFDPHTALARAGGRKVSPQLEEQFVLVAGDRVFFSAGSAELGARARAVLEAQAKFMSVRRDLTAMIEGHADDELKTAEDEVNLSYARAEIVRERLVAEGVSPDRLVVVARGREDPASACPDPVCAAQNRRAITVLMSTAALKVVRSAQAAANAALPGTRKVPETQ